MRVARGFCGALMLAAFSACGPLPPTPPPDVAPADRPEADVDDAGVDTLDVTDVARDTLDVTDVARDTLDVTDVARDIPDVTDVAPDEPTGDALETSVCAPREAYCDGYGCRDLSADRDHCGACGRVCGLALRCVDGRCASSTVRPRAPISTLSVRSARPTLFWTLPSDADGARVEVCATRSCERAEGRWEADGDRLRVPVALSAGVHFWRLFARRHGTVDTTPSPTWEFVVPAPSASGRAWPVSLLDVNGDGVEDRVELGAAASGPVSLDLYFGGGAGVTPDQTVEAGSRRVSTSTNAMGGVSTDITGVVLLGNLGDINGDGYADVAVERRAYLDYYRSGWGGVTDTLVFDAYAGGPRGIVRIGSTIAAECRLSGAGASVPRCRPLWSASPLARDPAYPFLVAGDRDGDGYGDLLRGWGVATGERAFGDDYGPWRWVFGVPAAPPETSPPADALSGACSAPLLAVGDFDTDGRSDLATPFCDGFNPSTDQTLRVSPGGTAAFQAIASCDGATLRSMAYQPTLTVLDADDDGYDDLRVDRVSFGDGAEASALFRGGPTGLSSDRCQRLPSTP